MGSCAAPSAKGDDKFITTDYLQQCPVESKRDPNTLDLFSKITDKQRHLFANKLSELPEMSKYSQGTESYQQFAVRIAAMLQDAEKFKELLPLLRKLGFQ